MYGVSTHSRPLGTTTSGGAIPPPVDHDITWANLTSATLAAGNKIRATAGAYAAGGSSAEALPINTAGTLSLTIAQIGTSRLFGIGATNTGGGFSRMTHCIDVESNGGFFVFESGSVIPGGPFATAIVGNIPRIEVSALNVVTYYLGNALLYTSLVARSGVVYTNATVAANTDLCENIVLSGTFA